MVARQHCDSHLHPGWNGSRDCARSRGSAAILRANLPFYAKTRRNLRVNWRETRFHALKVLTTAMLLVWRETCEIWRDYTCRFRRH